MAAAAPHPAVIEGPRVTLVAVAPEHAEALIAIRRQPEVFRWWSEIDPEFPFDEEAGTAVYAVRAEGRVIGLVQFFEELEPMYRSASMDIFLDAGVHGRGYGREVVAVVSAHLIDERGHHRLWIDPAADNAAAVAAYGAVGFKPVGTLRQSEKGPDGTWRDGLLMDLLAAELDRSLLTPR